MSKQVSHRELLEILQDAIEGGTTLDTEDKVFALVSDLATVVADHIGYMVSYVAPPITPRGAEEGDEAFEDYDGCWSIGFLPTASTPSDGGPLSIYDTDKFIDEWWAEAGLTRDGVDAGQRRFPQGVALDVDYGKHGCRAAGLER